MVSLKNYFQITFVAALLISLFGCAAIQTSVAKRNLDVQTKTSTAVFVDPVKKELRTVYVEVRSGVMEFDRRAFKKSIMEEFANNDNGYRVVDDPDAAQYHLSVYVLTMEKASPTAAEAALRKGYVGGSGVVAGAAAGGLATETGQGVVGGALLGGLAETVANAYVQDVTYMLIADIQIKEKAAPGVVVRKDTQISAKVSDAGSSTQRVSEVSTRKEYRTRIVTTANKANLEIEEAQPLMFQKTAYAMSGFF
jgi:hypothetical protein